MSEFDNLVDPEAEEMSLEMEKALDDIENLPIVLGDDVKDSQPPEYKQDVIDDYKLTRQLLILSIEEAQRSLKEARKLFALTSNPKHGEIIVKLLKVISDNSSTLFNMHTDTIAASKPKEDNLGNDKNVIVATTAEVLRSIRDAQES